MGKIANATFKGRTGSYNFEVYPIDISFEAVGALYIFTKRELDANGKWMHTLMYIGQTDSLKERVPNHEKWPCLNANGVNCICVHYDSNTESRIAKETDLQP